MICDDDDAGDDADDDDDDYHHTGCGGGGGGDYQTQYAMTCFIWSCLWNIWKRGIQKEHCLTLDDQSEVQIRALPNRETANLSIWWILMSIPPISWNWRQVISFE